MGKKLLNVIVRVKEVVMHALAWFKLYVEQKSEISSCPHTVNLIEQ